MRTPRRSIASIASPTMDSLTATTLRTTTRTTITAKRLLHLRRMRILLLLPFPCARRPPTALASSLLLPPPPPPPRLPTLRSGPRLQYGSHSNNSNRGSNRRSKLGFDGERCLARRYGYGSGSKPRLSSSQCQHSNQRYLLIPPTKSSSPLSLSSPTSRSPFQSSSRRRHFSSKSASSSPSGSPKPPEQPRPSGSQPQPQPPSSLSLSQRMRQLSREYGYAALGVYLALSALDLPFCYAAVSYLGTERIGRWEHVIAGYVGGLLRWSFATPVSAAAAAAAVADDDADASTGVGDGVPALVVMGTVGRQMEEQEVTEGKAGSTDSGKKRLLDEQLVVEGEKGGQIDHGYKEAAKADRGDNASVWTKLALAYAIHKSFIFIRVPVTAAITPKVVRTLRGWGWNIGKKRKK